jgi:hypothetical protein
LLTYSLRGGYRRLKSQYMSRFPIPELSDELEQALIECSQEADNKRADELTMEAYGLRSDERRMLNEWLERSEGNRLEEPVSMIEDEKGDD